MGFWLAEEAQFVFKLMEVLSWYVTLEARYFHIMGTCELIMQQSINRVNEKVDSFVISYYCFHSA